MRIITAGLLAAAAIGLSSCATMSEDQCLAGAWGERGYKDGLEGRAPSRLADHAQACAKYGVGPDESVYFAARERGLAEYCTPYGGFDAGRTGKTYEGVCPYERERVFLSAYEDGRLVGGAESALSSAESRITTLENLIEKNEEKIRGKRRELEARGLTDEQRRAIRDRIRELRDELEEARRELPRAEGEAREASRNLDALSYRFGGMYGRR